MRRSFEYDIYECPTELKGQLERGRNIHKIFRFPVCHSCRLILNDELTSSKETNE